PAGAAITAIILSLNPPIFRQGRVLLVSVALYGAAIAVFGIAPWLWLALLGLAISGAADTVSMGIRQTLRPVKAPAELRGRVAAVSMLFSSGGPQLGEVEPGVVAKAFGARVSVSSGGLLCVAAVAGIALSVPSLLHYVHPPAQSERKDEHA